MRERRTREVILELDDIVACGDTDRLADMIHEESGVSHRTGLSYEPLRVEFSAIVFKVEWWEGK